LQSVDAARGRAGKEARVTLFSPLKILNSGNLLLRQSTPLTRADSSLVIEYSLKISDLVARSCDLGLGTWVVVGDGFAIVVHVVDLPLIAGSRSPELGLGLILLMFGLLLWGAGSYCVALI
jgi:hypothetical protein